jgi:D-glycero-D-manno-heptose 1,7-bisphosphate phosphatase
MNKAVFLDRDGTVIRDYGYLADPEQIALLPGAGKALAALQNAGFLLVLITNQSGVGRGFFSETAVHAQHARLHDLLAPFGVRIAAIEYCPHAPEENCACRKPSPHMLLRAAAKLDVRLTDSFMIGDKPTDIAAGKAAGCRTVAIGFGDAQEDFCAPDLAAAADYICSLSTEEKKLS